MRRTLSVRNLLWGAWMFLPFAAMSQLWQEADKAGDEIYYAGINPIAPFTGIRGEISSLYLPVVSHLETGLAVFAGKTWGGRYNVETRVSYGSPRPLYNLFQVQSGINYCFNPGKRNWHPYAGAFIRLYSLHHRGERADDASIITQLCAGNRFIWKHYFLDIRLSQNIYAISWTSTPGAKAWSGFQPSLYKWDSPYMPYMAISLAYTFR